MICTVAAPRTAWEALTSPSQTKNETVKVVEAFEVTFEANLFAVKSRNAILFVLETAGMRPLPPRINDRDCCLGLGMQKAVISICIVHCTKQLSRSFEVTDSRQSNNEQRTSVTEAISGVKRCRTRVNEAIAMIISSKTRH
jgi:hypothetical protein